MLKNTRHDFSGRQRWVRTRSWLPTARVLGASGRRIRLAFGGGGPHGQPCPIATNVE
jgi:hypothetical protein